jgi:molecular chaperone HscB
MRMEDYFTLFSLPRQYGLSEADLHKRYIALQRATHPDMLVGKSPEQRAEAIGRSMRVNDGYDTLKSPLTRAEYLLELHGVIVGQESGSVAPDKEILMEMMELGEQLEECDSGASLKTVMDDIKASMTRAVTEIEGAFVGQHLDRAAQLTIRLKYLGKALEQAHMIFYRFKAASEADSSHSHDLH